LPQEVKDLLPATEKNLENGTQVTPTAPAPTQVQTADGTWTFKSYDKNEETINGADVKFVGTWEFTPTPSPVLTYKAVHAFVSGTAGR
ncbi:SHIRT domain-containing protein, partial [Streptococcus sp. DD11]|uniref:SHIRT domain-containing protein n=1 Tax=Streptococcus sp. DD11 TaxID=1777879 RepID=UPI000A5B2A00